MTTTSIPLGPRWATSLFFLILVLHELFIAGIFTLLLIFAHQSFFFSFLIPRLPGVLLILGFFYGIQGNQNQNLAM